MLAGIEDFDAQGEAGAIGAVGGDDTEFVDVVGVLVLGVFVVGCLLEAEGAAAGADLQEGGVGAGEAVGDSVGGVKVGGSCGVDGAAGVLGYLD